MAICCFAGLLCVTAQGRNAKRTNKAKAPTIEGKLEPFLGNPKFEMQQIFTGGRFPNVVVAANGNVLSIWGKESVRVRQSEDGGKTWGDQILIGNGMMGGGVTVDENNGNILAFVHPAHPPKDGRFAPRTMYRSSDNGKTWQKADAEFSKDINGNVPALHMAEHGITLRHGKHKGRLLRPARVYGPGPDRYSTAIYSDDGGKSWQPSKPYPVKGTGEGALTELSNGHLLYFARNSLFEKPADFTHLHSFAWSYDDGETWTDAGLSSGVPDGPRYRGEKKRGSNYNAHFGMLGGLVRLPVHDRDILVYSNADTPSHLRERITVWASFDGGRTWPIKRLVHGGPGAYSSMTAGRPGTPSEGWIYLMFEGGKHKRYDGAQLARFNLSWILQGEATGDGELPKRLQGGK